MKFCNMLHLKVREYVYAYIFQKQNKEIDKGFIKRKLLVNNIFPT